MLAAVLTTFFFALSGVSGQRVAMRLGSFRGNLVRLGIAALLLGLLTLILSPSALEPVSFGWFFLSGLIGFGVGDVALFLAYERIGSRLSVLLILGLAPLFGIGLEWVWLGQGISLGALGCAFLILSGVALALLPRRGGNSDTKAERRGNFGFGVVAGVIAGFGQGTGAVISRKAEAVVVEMGGYSTGITAAFQRVFAGLLFALLVFWLVRWFRPALIPATRGAFAERKLWPWILGASLFGPVIGVSCFQWSLQSLESGIVLAIVATTPIVMMPLALITEGDRPTGLAIFGAVLAVAGVVLLQLVVR
ncbi:MAG: DMT family transporter [Verrucomicrobiota bacterium]